MRIAVLAAAAFLASAAVAVAGPAEVQVNIGPKLQKTAAEKYGVAEIDRLADSLRTQVEQQLARTGAYQDARVELTLVDAVPNRPTFKQLGDRPGLSFQSFGIGGARIEGAVTTANGVTTPVAYKYYESDIREAPTYWTWHDADQTFSRFARKLASGDTLASR